MIDLYEVLQVDRRAEPEVVRAAYRALARKNHPDFGGDVRHMASINEAWAVLGDAARRGAYDAEPQPPGDQQGGVSTPSASAPAGPPSDGRATNGSAQGLGARRRPSPHTGGSVLDFGRYAGWTVGSLVDQDPDYLEWLARTPIGRRVSNEIDAALALRAAELAAHPAGGPEPRRRAFL
ncbi:MAG: DnaJ domain-containing protein [Candidatus Limnocylindrales bacterium]